MAITIHIDQPAEITLIFERDTTPKLDLDLYADEAQSVPVDVADFTFEAYFKNGFDTSNGSSAMTFNDGDIVKKPDGVAHRIRIPISQVQSNDSDQLLDRGVILVYWTDGSGHRERLIRGEFTARR